MPREFCFHAKPAPDGDLVIVSWDTPREKKVLGELRKSECRLSLLLQVFPSIKPFSFIKAFMYSIQLPTDFALTAKSAGDRVVNVSFRVDIETSGSPLVFLRSRDIPTHDWNLNDLGFFLTWIKEAKDMANGGPS